LAPPECFFFFLSRVDYVYSFFLFPDGFLCSARGPSTLSPLAISSGFPPGGPETRLFFRVPRTLDHPRLLPFLFPSSRYLFFFEDPFPVCFPGFSSKLVISFFWKVSFTETPSGPFPPPLAARSVPSSGLFFLLFFFPCRAGDVPVFSRLIDYVGGPPLVRTKAPLNRTLPRSLPHSGFLSLFAGELSYPFFPLF